jgi:hypothetical protein
VEKIDYSARVAVVVSGSLRSPLLISVSVGLPRPGKAASRKFKPTLPWQHAIDDHQNQIRHWDHRAVD